MHLYQGGEDLNLLVAGDFNIQTPENQLSPIAGCPMIDAALLDATRRGVTPAMTCKAGQAAAHRRDYIWCSEHLASNLASCDITDTIH
eukprot:5030753-Amphidinium_carterae.1